MGDLRYILLKERRLSALLINMRGTISNFWGLYNCLVTRSWLLLKYPALVLYVVPVLLLMVFREALVVNYRD